MSRHGATVEDMAVEVNNAKKLLETAEADWKNMTKLNNVRDI
jgi:4-hydroxyphenylpyruvate dioxygenase-like putative hemolysin